jgi:NADH-quinone oxidoreductase subunit J
LLGWEFAPGSKIVRLSTIPENVQNTRAIGQVLYTQYFFLFQLSGLILLVAMIGAIVLTHRDRSVAKRQNITRQQSRLVGDTLEILTPRTGAGVQELGIYRPKPIPEPAHRALPVPHEHAHEDH